MFNQLKNISSRPLPFEFYTTPELWNDDYISKQMLHFHLNEDMDLASRNKQFINRSAEWIINKFQLNENKSVIDFGCGPGLYTSKFASTGANVTGIDLSTNSINYAKTKASESNLQINYINQNYLEFEAEQKYDLITMIFCDFCVLNHGQRKLLLNKFHKILKPNGSIILDVCQTEFFNSAKEEFTIDYSEKNGFWSSEPHYEIRKVFKYSKEKLVLNKHTIIEKNRTRTIYNWLQSYSINDFQSLASENELAVTDKYGDIAGSDYNESGFEMALVLSK